jgi:hypothetical protein
MQLKELDKKAIMELKDSIDELECRVNELSVMRLKNDLPLELILREYPYYKNMVANGYKIGERQTRELQGDRVCFPSKMLDYSMVLESGRFYTTVTGTVIPYAMKIIEGTGVFNLRLCGDTLFSFSVLEGDKYVLFPQFFISWRRTSWCVEEQEGHIRYVCAMSTFSNAKIEEVK